MPGLQRPGSPHCEPGKVKIGSLLLFGKISRHEVERIVKMFPAISIRINEDLFENGKRVDIKK